MIILSALLHVPGDMAAIGGSMYAMLGPTVGALLAIALTEGLRVWFGTSFVGAANTIYGILLVLFIISMPRGIMAVVATLRAPRTRAAPAGNEQRS